MTLCRLRLAGLIWPWLCCCAAVEPFAEVDLEDPDWEVWMAQAVWTVEADRPSLAGELIVARHERGDTFVSFSNPPIPFFTARATPHAWRMEFVERGRNHAGRGRPPARFVWFALPDILAGGAPPRQWRIERPADDEIELSHARGEHIRLVIDR